MKQAMIGICRDGLRAFASDASQVLRLRVGQLTVAVLLLLPALAAQSLPPKSQYVFRIPVFSGTQLFEGNLQLSELNPPFGTIVKVFRTTDGRPLDKESVIAFYRTTLESKGWKEGISKRQNDEPYLSMQTDVFEALPDHTSIQVAGDFYLWVAPQDGMLTIFVKQWRISSSDQPTHDSLQAMIALLTKAAANAGYTAMKVESDPGGWEADYENEYLVDRVLYGLTPSALISKHPPLSMDAPPESLTVALLTYRDTDTARAEKAQREQAFKSWINPPQLAAAIKGKVVVTIVGSAAAKGKIESLLSALTSP